MFRNSRSNGAGRRNSTPSESRSKFHYMGSPLSTRMIFILLHYLLSFVTVTSSAHQRFLCCVVLSSTAISVPHSVRVQRYYGPLGGGGGPSLGDCPPGGGGGPSSLGWGRTRGGKNNQTTPATTSTSSRRQLLGAADAQTAHHATFSTAPTHQLLGSANAETTPARAPAAAADRKQRPDATCEGKNR